MHDDTKSDHISESKDDLTSSLRSHGLCIRKPRR